MKKTIHLAVFFIALLLCSCIGVFAWNEPNTPAPGNNIAQPINSGTESQDKAGAFSAKKLSVNDGTVPCCASYYTLSINEYGLNKPTLQFHDSGAAEAQIILSNDIGSGQRGLIFQSTQTTMSGKFTGNLESETALETPVLCLNSDCRGVWPTTGITAGTCTTGFYVSGFDANGQIICSPLKNIYWSPNPCSSNPPASGKRIFVSSTTITGNTIMDEASADVKCQNMANTAGYAGTFKALIYIGGRSPATILKSGNTFWNGQKTGTAGTTCIWNVVAASNTDFFTDEGGGQYLVNPIKYNEQGLYTPNATVWTGFKPTGGGNFTLLPNGTNECSGLRAGLCYRYKSSGYDPYYFKTYTYLGSSSSTTAAWAGTQITTDQSCSGSCYYIDYAGLTECLANSYAIYCVEQ
jgi:hypothetical protein